MCTDLIFVCLHLFTYLLWAHISCTCTACATADRLLDCCNVIMCVLYCIACVLPLAATWGRLYLWKTRGTRRHAQIHLEMHPLYCLCCCVHSAPRHRGVLLPQPLLLYY